MIEERLGRLCESIALGFGATARLDYHRMYPATINTADEARFSADEILPLSSAVFVGLAEQAMPAPALQENP